MWSEHLDCKCVYRMCGRNVLQIGMYLSVELWVEAIFIYIVSYLVYLFVCCFVFVRLGPQPFTSFVLFMFIIFSSWRQTVHAAILKTRLQPSDVKTPKPVIDASMPNVMYIVWTTFKLLRLFRSVFVTQSVLALSERAAAPNAEKDWVQSRLISSKRLYFTQTSELCLFLCNRTQTHRERKCQLITVLGSKCGL